MCGIGGIVFQDNRKEVLPSVLARMASKLRYRGPDEEGQFTSLGVGFTHRRLKVLDLLAGQQPMTDPSGMVTLVFNGEIFNFRQLRKELKVEGYHFRTVSDTEVLLFGYLHWGIDVLHRIEGMFAFAVWDQRNETLFLARDRLGQKPLYWASLTDDSIVFASELTALLASGFVSKRLDKTAMACYLSFGYVLGNSAIIEGVQRLPPGSFLKWKRGEPFRIYSYWNLAEKWIVNRTNRRSDVDLEEEFGHLLDRAVEKRLVSDVPLGAFLSGGLDSSVIVAYMRKYLDTVRTFSIGFQESSYDETPWARKVAGFLRCMHHDEIVAGVKPDLLAEIISRQDEPFADTSVIPTYILSKMTRNHVTVALSGDGGDELLAGYVTHAADQLHGYIQKIPKPVLQLLHRVVESIPDSRRKVSTIFKMKQFMRGVSLDKCDAHAWWRTLINTQGLEQLTGMSSAFLAESTLTPFRKAYQESQGLSELDRSLYVDYKTWLPDDILVKVDRASMAHGLEVRSPFLDHHLVEFCTGLPVHMKFKKLKGKIILRNIAEKILPSFVIRRPKRGFNSPVSYWLVGSWREVCEDAFSAKSVLSSGVLNTQAVQDLWQDHLLQRKDYGYLLFSLLVLILWLRSLDALTDFPG
ncbi:MAG: asparagine synthase (glutamine-hydrolyzing) [Proteobacteria bacterium]|nr:asparagine synthase (glutamine-hydrolyzing) [Pseudomonadota bacterium]